MTVIANQQRDHPFLAIGLRLAAGVMIAMTLALVKLLGEHDVNIVETVFYRQLFALPVACIWAMQTIGLRGLKTKRPWHHTTRSFLGITAMLFNFMAVTMLPLAEATSISFAVPIFGTIFAALFLGEPTGIHRWSAVLLGFFGVLIVANPQGSDLPTLGITLALVGTVMTAAVTIVVREMNKTEQPPVIVFWFTVLSLPPLAVAMFFFATPHDAVEWALLAAVGTAGGLAQLFLTASLRFGPVSLVLPMDYGQILWATFIGWAIWSNWPLITTWIGATIIVTSGLYIAWREQVKRRERLNSN